MDRQGYIWLSSPNSPCILYYLFLSVLLQSLCLSRVGWAVFWGGLLSVIYMVIDHLRHFHFSSKDSLSCVCPLIGVVSLHRADEFSCENELGVR